MKTIIAGGRDKTRIADVIDAIHKSGFEITEVIEGGCRGVDENANWIAHHYLKVPVCTINAKWEEQGLAAGPIRNKRMAEVADALILVWDGKSKGSLSMLNHAKEHNLKIYQHIV